MPECDRISMRKIQVSYGKGFVYKALDSPLLKKYRYFSDYKNQADKNAPVSKKCGPHFHSVASLIQSEAHSCQRPFVWGPVPTIIRSHFFPSALSLLQM